MAGFVPLEKVLVFEQRSATCQDPGQRRGSYTRESFRRDQFLEQVEHEPYLLKGLLRTLRKQGTLRWSHKPGFCRVEAGKYWIEIMSRKGARIVSNISVF